MDYVQVLIKCDTAESTAHYWLWHLFLFLSRFGQKRHNRKCCLEVRVFKKNKKTLTFSKKHLELFKPITRTNLQVMYMKQSPSVDFRKRLWIVLWLKSPNAIKRKSLKILTKCKRWKLRWEHCVCQTLASALLQCCMVTASETWYSMPGKRAVSMAMVLCSIKTTVTTQIEAFDINDV